MLTSETKQKINSLRQILVGKVPNPTDQVEQITNALIYKYMDDMDQQAITFGGKAGFFIGDYEKYAWKNLMDTKIGAQERTNLYTDALEKMSSNKNLSPIFRDILKDAFLPYRAPETLNMFLHEIDSFTYDNSEELGNAFEYLLSIMGSQGDAGMFRTPRHIIDFIVEVVNPTKNDTVLDPACGTAGFLISAYKHIKASHDGVDNKTGKKTSKEKQLTSAEMRKIHKQFSGYDISPNMAKLSRVNMFLHQFPEPQIYEYDTLSSDERWGEEFDVILANPPFMSPKGGIIPHGRFGIKANRAEVLFVDYILKHLKPKGRAGIIVPEGVIFQSGNAYKQLRKALVEDGLWAVVSLPQGVFNPYAGVKTSILLFDNNVTKQSDSLLFVKIENDGFDLGAQRKEIDKNDLPKALKILSKWRDEQKFDEKQAIAHIVKKSKIAESDDYNLSGERYRDAVDYSNVKWEMVELGDICEIKRGTSITKKNVTEGHIPVIAGGQQPAYFHNEFNRTGETITVSGSGAYAGFVNYFDTPIFASDCSTLQAKDDFLLKYVYSLLKAKQEDIYKLQSGGGQPHVYPKDLQKIKIPLPPLEIQKQIVADIDSYQKVIDGAEQVVKNWKPNIKIDPDWEMVKLGEVTKIARGGSPRPINEYITKDENGINWIKIGDVAEGEKYVTKTKEKIKPSGISKTRQVKVGDFVLSNSMSFGRPYILKIDGAIHDGWLLIRINDKEQINQDFLYLVLGSNMLQTQYEKMATGGVVKNLNSNIVKEVKIPLPPMDIQLQIIAEIEIEQKIIDQNKKIVEIFKQKIEQKINEVWGE